MTQSVQSYHPFQSVIQTIYGYREAHGGVLKVESKESEGTEFLIKLPS